MARKNAFDKMDDLQAQVEHTLTRQMFWDQPVTHDATQYAGQNHVWNPLNTAYGAGGAGEDDDAGETRPDWT